MTAEDSRLQDHYFANIQVGSFEHTAAIREAASQESRSFLGSARQSHDGTLFRFGLFKRINLVASRHYEGINRPIVRQAYEEWCRIRQVDSIAIAKSHKQLPTETLDILARQGDPALLAIHFFEGARQRDYPNFILLSQASRDREGVPIQVGELQSLYEDYEMILRSIHGPLIAGVGSTAIVGS